MTLKNWGRDYENERNHEIKYSWEYTGKENYFIRILDLQKILGRYHEDFKEEERYSVELVYVPDLSYPDRVEEMTLIQTKTVTQAYNITTDIAENYPDPLQLEEDFEEGDVVY